MPDDLLRWAALTSGPGDAAGPFRDLRPVGFEHPVFDEEANRAIDPDWALALSHLLPILLTPDDSVLGYWLHPDETADPPPIVGVDSESFFFVPDGHTLAEVLAAHAAAGDALEFAWIAAWLADHGFPITARQPKDLPANPIVTPPEN